MSTSTLFNCHESGPHRVLIQCTLWPGPHSTFSGTRTPKKMEHYYGWKIWWSESWKGKLQMIHCKLKQSAALNDMFMNPLALFNWHALEHSHSGLNHSTTGVPGSTPLAFAWMSASTKSINLANVFNYLFMNMPAIPKCQNSVTHAFRNTTKWCALTHYPSLPIPWNSSIYFLPLCTFHMSKDSGNLRNNIQWGIMLSFYGILVQTCIRRRLVLICLHSEFHLMWFHDGAHPWICAPSSEVSSREHPFCFFLTSELISFVNPIVILSANTYPVKPKDSPRYDT